MSATRVVLQTNRRRVRLHTGHQLIQIVYCLTRARNPTLGITRCFYPALGNYSVEYRCTPYFTASCITCIICYLNNLNSSQQLTVRKNRETHGAADRMPRPNVLTDTFN